MVNRGISLKNIVFKLPTVIVDFIYILTGMHY
jgi:hypothetical protein